MTLNSWFSCLLQGEDAGHVAPLCLVQAYLVLYSAVHFSSHILLVISYTLTGSRLPLDTIKAEEDKYYLEFVTSWRLLKSTNYAEKMILAYTS